MPSLHDRIRGAPADRYAVERELGRGGMAVVFLARDLKPERPVAIKILEHDVAAQLGAERLRREIETAAKPDHRNVLPLDDLRAALEVWKDADPSYKWARRAREKLTQREGER